MRQSAKVCIFFFTLLTFVIFGWQHILPDNIHPDQKEPQEFECAPSDWQFIQRAYPFDRIDNQAYATALVFKKNKAASQTTSGGARIVPTWHFSGPVNVGGRITDIEITSRIPQRLYAGSASGGIFRSDDMGILWESIFDDAHNISIGDMALSPSNPEIIYVGTGEANAGGGSVAYDGDGVYKSSDGGDSWHHVGLDSIGSVGRILTDPQNPDVCYVGAMGSLFKQNSDRGVFRTRDGGVTWKKVLFVNDSTGVIDIVIDPLHPIILYAATWQRVRQINRQKYGGPSSAIYRSGDGGDTWTKISDPIFTDAGRIGLALYTTANTEMLMALVCNTEAYLKGIYKTIDRGNTWQSGSINSINDLPYSYWFGRILIDPSQPNLVYVTNFDMYKSANGGNSWATTFDGTHGDQHILCINPLNSNQLFLGNDGGVWQSDDGGDEYIHLNNLPITQFYTCEVDYSHPERLFGGAQDNGTISTPTGEINDWDAIYYGDGFRVLVDPEDNNYVYAEYQYGNFARSSNGGQSFTEGTPGISSSELKNWNTPIEMDPNNPAVLYYGGQKVYKSNNHGSIWILISPNLTGAHPDANIVYGTITSISVSPVDEKIIFAGTDDGHVQVTTMGGTSWLDVSGELPDRWVTAVETDPQDSQTAYVTFSGYRFGSSMSHIYKTTNLGQTWEDISGDLPDIPINDFIVTPINRNYFIATDIGVFSSTNFGLTWELLGTGLPNTIVSDILYHPAEKFLIAATYGRGMYKIAIDEEGTAVYGPIIAPASVTLYPNPTSGQTTVNLLNLNLENISYGLYDLFGKSLAIQVHPAADRSYVTFDASSLPSGLYLFSVLDRYGKMISQAKWIKE